MNQVLSKVSFPRLIIPLIALCTILPSRPYAAPYSNDTNTVRLDHFDGSTIGAAQGTVSFTNSPLDQCANLPSGAFIMYSPSITYSSSGTIELWVKPSVHPCSIMCNNWAYTTSHPSFGYVTHLTLNPDGTVHWYGSGNFDSATSVPTNKWSHLAVSWGSDGTTIYVNGVADVHSATKYTPGNGYLYLNSSWGQSAVGSVDELRISNVARPAAEIYAHYVANSKKYHQLDVTVNGSGSVSPTNGWYEEGTNLNLSATPDADWLFMGWSGDLTGGYASSNTVLVMNASKQIAANFSDDADRDGLLNTNEWALGTDPRNSDSDGDLFDDGFEVAHGYSPLDSDAVLTDYIRAHGAGFDLYPSNAVLDVAVGHILMNITNGSVTLHLQPQLADNLTGEWTNAGSSVEWSLPSGGSNQFFRVRAAP